MFRTKQVDCDVVIAGTGPTGLTLANHLGTLGVRTPAVERLLARRSASASADLEGAPMNTAGLVAIDTHTHLEVSCRNPWDNYGGESYRAADRHFRSSRPPTMDEIRLDGSLRMAPR